MNRLLLTAMLLLPLASVSAESLRNPAGHVNLVLSLEKAEEEVLAASPRYLAAAQEERAAASRAAAQDAQRYPRISLEGSYRYLAVVPELTPAFPGAQPQKLGDNTNYSLGPAAYWTLWDHGAIKENVLSARAAARAKQQDTRAVKRQVLLSGRTTYFLVALRGEQVNHLARAVQLANEQYTDIVGRARAGDKARLDVLQAHQELLARQRQLSQARADLAGSLRDLAALSGGRFTEGASLPLDSRVPETVLRLVPPATATVSIEPLDQLMARMKAYGRGSVSPANPAVAGPEQMAESAQLSADSATSGLWPKLHLSAKSSLEYPNGPVLESFYQNTAGVTLNWPLFEAGASQSRAEDSRELSRAYRQRAAQALADIGRDWDKTQDQLANLEYQERLAAESAAESAESARIAYDAYRAGARTFLEVQNANFRLLDAQLQLAQIRVQLLNNYAQAASLRD